MKKFILGFIIVITLVGCSSSNNFGPLGSTHRHADLKVYVLGNPIDFGVSKYQLQDELTHFENRDGDVAHTHATGITLGFLFETLRMKIDGNCLTSEAGNTYCNKGNAELKVFVKSTGTDWDQIFYPSDYRIQDLDKILVTYGTENEEGIKTQMESVTDKAAIT